jgi:hypothetical protein
MTRRGRLERERFWRGVILEQEASGLPVSAFCRKRDLSQGSFYRWRRKLTQCEHGDAAAEFVREDAVAKFIPVALDAPPTVARSGCEIVLPDGCRIIVPIECDANWLREILEVMRGTPSC